MRKLRPVPGRARIPSHIHLTAKFTFLPWSWLSKALPLTPKGTGLRTGRPGWCEGPQRLPDVQCCGWLASTLPQDTAEGEGLGQPLSHTGPTSSPPSLGGGRGSACGWARPGPLGLDRGRVGLPQAPAGAGSQATSTQVEREVGSPSMGAAGQDATVSPHLLGSRAPWLGPSSAHVRERPGVLDHCTCAKAGLPGRGARTASGQGWA